MPALVRSPILSAASAAVCNTTRGRSGKSRACRSASTEHRLGELALRRACQQEQFLHVHPAQPHLRPPGHASQGSPALVQRFPGGVVVAGLTFQPSEGVPTRRLHPAPLHRHGVGELSRLVIKAWAKTLRRSLSERSVADVVGLLSMILGEAVDEGLFGSNSCRNPRLNSGDQPERPHAEADEVTALAERTPAGNPVLIVTAAYTGMRWGELAGLQWSRVDLDKQEIRIDARDGALHEPHGKLHLNPPKTPAGVRTVHLPTFLAEQLAELAVREADRAVRVHRPGRRPAPPLHFRRRVWLPALQGDTTLGWAPIKPHMHFHDLRHTPKTRLIEDGVTEVLQHKRIGHKFRGVMGVYSHVTRPMVDAMLAGLQARCEQYGSKTL